MLLDVSPFCSDRNDFEDENIDTTRNIRESETLYVYSSDNHFVKVSYKRNHQKIDSFFRH